MNFITSKRFWNVTSTVFIVAFIGLLSASIRLHVAMLQSPTKPGSPPHVIPYNYHGLYYYLTPEQSHSAAWFATWLFPLLALFAGLAWLSNWLRRRYGD